jgi:hypothetical protein
MKHKRCSKYFFFILIIFRRDSWHKWLIISLSLILFSHNTYQIILTSVELSCTILFFYKTQLNHFRCIFVQVALTFYWMPYNTISMDVLSCRRWEMVSFFFVLMHVCLYIFFSYSTHSYSFLILIIIKVDVLRLSIRSLYSIVCRKIYLSLHYCFRWGCAMHWFSILYLFHCLCLFTIVTVMNTLII